MITIFMNQVSHNSIAYNWITLKLFIEIKNVAKNLEIVKVNLSTFCKLLVPTVMIFFHLILKLQIVAKAQ